MDVGCNCFNVATAAKVPVKRYNLLVPALFPVTEPSVAKPLGITLEKNVKRLGEYLERNEHRIPKVSRRLARRLQSDLRRGRLGYVRVAVATFSHLIAADGGRYARLYTPELIARYPAKRRHVWSCAGGPWFPAAEPHLGSVIGLLLSSPSRVAQQWGLDLMVAVLKLQDSAECVGQLEALVPLLCQMAMLRSDEGGGGGEREGVVAGSLRVLLEYLRFCSRVGFVSTLLDVMTYAVLGTLEAEGQGMVDPGAVAAVADEVDRRSGGPGMLRTISVGVRVGTSSPGTAALLVYNELSHMTVDAAEGRKVLEFLLRFLDADPARWLGGPALGAGLGLMRAACTHEHQRYLLFSTLMAHVGGGGGGTLGPRQRAAVLTQAMTDGVKLERGLAAPALLLALQDLPTALAAAGGGAGAAEAAQLGRDVEVAVGTLACRVGNRLQLTAVLGAAVGRLQGPAAPEAAPALRCCADAAAAYPDLPEVVTGGASPPPHLSDVLLRGLLGVCVSWPACHRLHAHAIMGRALSGASAAALSPLQAESLLSALWHEAALPDNAPASYAAIEAGFGAVLGATGGATELLKACHLAMALQDEAAAGGGRLENASPAQRCAVLATAAAMWARLAAALQHAELAVLGVQGVQLVLPSLRPAAGALGLAAAGGAALSPFTEIDAARAAAFLPQATLPPAGAALGGVAAFKGLRPAALIARFAPLPVAAIVPHMALGNVLGSHRAPGGGISRRAQKVLQAFKAKQPAQGVAGEAALVGGISGGEAEPRPATGTPAAAVAGPGHATSFHEVLAGVEAALASALPGPEE